MPASLVKRVVDSAVGGATVVIRPWLGVKGEGVSAEIARSLGLERPQGLVITELYAGGPGQRAGLREGDVITAVDGAEINDQGGLNFRVGTKEPNEPVALSVLRDGRTDTVNARVQRLPGDIDLDRAVVISQGGLSGAQVIALNPALAESLGGDPFATGVIVGQVDDRGYARRGVGLRRGDVILAVNGRPVTSPQQLANLGRGSQLSVQRGGQQGVLVVR